MDLDALSGNMLPNIENGIPDKVTKKELRIALEEYARADREWKDYNKLRYLSAKEDAGDHLYRLAKAILEHNGFYTYRQAEIELMDGKAPSPNPEDFE